MRMENIRFIFLCVICFLIGVELGIIIHYSLPEECIETENDVIINVTDFFNITTNQNLTLVNPVP